MNTLITKLFNNEESEDDDDDNEHDSGRFQNNNK